MQTDSTEEQSRLALRSKRDADLLRLYTQQRSEEAFAELGRRYARLVFATCLRETQNRTLAEDASQVVFLLLSQKAGSLLRIDSLAGWLYTAARYLSRNLIKQERRRERNEARAMQEESLSLPTSGNPLWEQIEPHFHAALDRLKPADRVAILLRYVQDESLAEVGRRLGIPENTARMRINRAMEKIRAHLAHVGIGVSVAILAALLEERAAQALPVTLFADQTLHAMIGASPSPSTQVAARRTVRFLLLLGLRFPLCLILGTALLVGGVLLFHRFQSERWTSAEQHRLYTSLRGDWTGTLDFVDDASKQHFTMPTTVVFGTRNGDNILRFSATYPHSDREDITTLSGDPRTGVFVADNGGPRRSHNLHSTGDLIKLGTNEFAFRGWSYPQNAAVRLRISLTATYVSIYEEYRKQGQSDYQFRNRFLLHRSIPQSPVPR